MGNSQHHFPTHRFDPSAGAWSGPPIQQADAPENVLADGIRAMHRRFYEGMGTARRTSADGEGMSGKSKRPKRAVLLQRTTFLLQRRWLPGEALEHGIRTVSLER